MDEQDVPPLRLLVSLTVLFVSVAMVALLFARPIAESRLKALCVESKQLGPHLRFIKNCDSYEFLRLARDPRGLLSGTGTVWQSRPGYPAAGWLAALPFRAGNAFATRFAASRFGGRRWYQSPVDPYYVGFIFLNWMTLIVAAALFTRMSGSRSPFEAATLLPLTMLLVNGITKAFFWTPHLQIFNVLIPVLSCAIAARLIKENSEVTAKRLALLGLACGLASMIYGAFLLILATVTVAMILVRATLDRRRTGLSILAAGFAFAAPWLVWRAYVLATTGHFYVHETEAYHQFVWIAETLRAGVPVFLNTLGEKLAAFASTLPAVLGMPVAAVAVTWAGQRIRRGRAFSEAHRELKLAIASFLIVAVPFFALMGYYTARLTWELAPPLLLLFSLVLGEIHRTLRPENRKFLTAALSTMAVAYLIYVVGSDQTAYLASRQ